MSPVKGVDVASVSGEPWAISTPIGFRSMVFDMDVNPSDDGSVVYISHFPANYAIPAHAHDCDYLSVVVSGSMEITRKTYGPGHVRRVRAGTGYGPLKVGPAGCTLIEVFSHRSGIPAKPLRQVDIPRFIEIAEELGMADKLTEPDEP